MGKGKEQLIALHTYLVEEGHEDNMDVTISYLGLLSTREYGELLRRVRDDRD